MSVMVLMAVKELKNEPKMNNAASLWRSANYLYAVLHVDE
jgi:hypothetical protein